MTDLAAVLSTLVLGQTVIMTEMGSSWGPPVFTWGKPKVEPLSSTTFLTSCIPLKIMHWWLSIKLLSNKSRSFGPAFSLKSTLFILMSISSSQRDTLLYYFAPEIDVHGLSYRPQ
jgi:hypothetical protein